MDQGEPTAEAVEAGRAVSGAPLPETPHELPYDRSKVDDLLVRVRAGGQVDLLHELLAAVDWDAFGGTEGAPLSAVERAELDRYYREKFADVGPLFLAELLSTEFITEQRARGDLVFSERLLALGRGDPELWAEIRGFFRRKEMATAMLAAAHRPMPSRGARPAPPEPRSSIPARD